MLHLIHAHRHHIRLVQQNIRSHQYRIGKKSRIDIVRMLCRLILELGHPVQLSHIGKAVENPCQLRVSRYMGLIINAVLLRVQSRRNIQGQKRTRPSAQLRRVLADRDRVKIHHTVKTFIFIT